MYAVIESGAKQYRVEPGQVLDVELLGVEPGAKITLDRVLFVSNDSGPQIGRPLVSGAKVQAEVVDNVRDEKVVVYKFKHKVNYHRKRGHRQNYTRLKIVDIISGS